MQEQYCGVGRMDRMESRGGHWKGTSQFLAL